MEHKYMQNILTQVLTTLSWRKAKRQMCLQIITFKNNHPPKWLRIPKFFVQPEILLPCGLLCMKEVEESTLLAV